jgi:rubrerythrin
MKFIFLRFCYGVEIGAYLAYVGHYEASGDRFIKSIKRDELRHMVMIKRVLAAHGRKPSLLFNIPFLIIGNIIRLTCKITPLVLLDGVAQIMEVFNIISYDIMAKSFPKYKQLFNEMEQNEKDHEIYLSTFPKPGRI